MKNEEVERVNRILNDLKTSIETDVYPVLQPNRPEGGYFGVTRTLLCYVDILGLLLEGWSGKLKKNGDKDDFATPKKAKVYIKKVLSEVDELYELNGDLLYDMYRHGTVHIYSPKKLVSRQYPKKTVEWLIYKGGREQWDYYENKSFKFRHLQIIEWAKDKFVLPISILVLYGDVVVSIDLFRKMIYEDKSRKLLKNFLGVADALDTVYDGTKDKFWEKAIKV